MVTASYVSLRESLNLLLDDPHHPVRLEARGQSICVRAKLPSKTGGNPSFQRISLGIKGDLSGIKKSLWIAREVQVKLMNNSFQWRDYDSNYHSPETIEKSLEQFKTNFFNEPKRQRNLNAANTTWRCGYLPYLKKLKEFQEIRQIPFDSELFMLVMTSYKPNSNGRLKCAIVLKKLAEQEGIDLPKEWKEVSRGYQSLKQGKLKYPSDSEIVELRNKITDPNWKWVFGMLATYGLRTHEIFFCEAEDLLNESNQHNTIRIGSETKTGERLVYPLRSEWVELFDLKNIQRPNVNTSLENRMITYISVNVSRAFKKYEIGYIPYSLRHAWAIRSIHHGLNPSIASKMMGHSVQMHTKTYHYYLNEKDMDKAYVNAIS